MPGSRPCLVECPCRKHINNGYYERTPAHREKIGNALRGRSMSDEQRAQISATLMGHEVSDEQREKQRVAHIGRMHTSETRIKMSIAHKGHTRNTSEVRAKIRAANIKHREECQNDACGECSTQNPSNLSWTLIDFLVAAGFDPIIAEQRFGRYTVDAYLPEEHVAFEADGDYWHRDRDPTARDAYLLREFDLPVVRLTETEIKIWRIK